MLRRVLLSAATAVGASVLVVGGIYLLAGAGADSPPQADTGSASGLPFAAAPRVASDGPARDAILAALEDDAEATDDSGDASSSPDSAPEASGSNEPSSPAAPSPAGPTADYSDQNSVLSLVNATRAEEGLPPLTIDAKLSAAAGAQAVYQASNQQMTHDGGGGLGARVTAAGYRWCAVAENVAAGYTSGAAVHNGWVGSPGHLANILSDNTQMGLAKATGSDGRVYWAEVFGTPC